MTDAIPSAEELARATSEVLEPAFARLARVAHDVRTRHRPTDWSETDLVETRDLIFEELALDPMQVGMGYVSVPGIIDGRERYMLWWQQHEGRTSRLRLNFDRSSIDVYDYVEMEWFHFLPGERTRVTYGPYVDYSGAELYIITATVPVEVEGEFIGVVGVDLLFEELEGRLVDVLRRADTEAVVINAERRVIAANSGRWVQGSRLREMPLAGTSVDGGTVLEAAELPLGNGWLLALTDLPISRK